MNRFYSIAFASLASVVLINVAEAAPAAAVAEVTGALGAPLTLTSAKQLVTQTLSAAGQTGLRAGRAEFDGNGNVAVEVVTLQGLPVRHMLVLKNSGMVTDARTHAPVSSKG